MKTSSLRARTLACALLSTTAYCGLTASPAAAQLSPRPLHRSLDENGVDLVRGDFVMTLKEGSIGSGDAELELIRTGGSYTESQWDRYTFYREVSGTSVTIHIGLPGDVYEKFTGTLSGSTFTPTKANGGSLSGSGSNYAYTAPDGSSVSFFDPAVAWESGHTANFCAPGINTGSCSLVARRVRPANGGVIQLEWDVAQPSPGYYDSRLFSVTSRYGYSIEFAYETDTWVNGSWKRRTGADFINTNVSPSAQASVSYAYPSAGTADFTDMAGNVWRITDTSVRRPGESSPSFTVTRDFSTGIVSSVTKDGVTTSYSRSVSGTTGTLTKTNALSQTMTLVSDLNIGEPTSITDGLGRTTGFQYDTSGRLTRVTAPEGNYVQLTLDARGNATQTQFVPKPGSSSSTITTSAAFPSSCTNVMTCNSPTSVTDARGNVTDYLYDSTHGGVLSVTAPAPTPGAVRPQTRYSYTQVGTGAYRLTDTAACQTMSSCIGDADKVKSTLVYDSQGNLTSASSGSGGGTLTATSTMTYTPMGDLATVDGPLPGTADTTKYRYDAGRRMIGAVGPDPDGAGALKHRAVKTSLGSAGQVTKVEQGNVNSQSDSDWTAFSSLQAVETGYDANMRPTVTKLTSGGTTYALAQTSYDAVGRPECVAQRMNPSVFASLPSSACTLGTQGSYGPDRITKTTRDAAGQVTQVKTALGVTGEEANEVTATYSSNGQVQTVTDAENNKTTYVYDGHDRLYQTQYPSATKGSGTSNSSDYEQLTYDDAGNVTTFRNRANEMIGFTYDALNRLTLKNLPGSEPDATYTYDLLGRMTSAVQNGLTISLTYDALGRQLTQTVPIPLVANPVFTSEYDLAGRRTRFTWPVDASSSTAYYVDYDYLVTGEMEKVREKGATSGAGVLATYGYDDRGRRTSLTRGNGATTGYGYDAVSRLTSLSQDFAGGTTHDLTLTYGYNPASQIVSTTRSNDLYAWKGHGSGTTSSTADGLNRLSAHGGATPTYDARGNITFDGTYSYTYSSENLMTSGANSGALGYDPLMRFYQSGTSYFIHDTDGQLIGNYYNGSIFGRYVPGAADDEPVAEITKTGDRIWYHGDERGSVIASSRDSGANSWIVAYDEYGKRSSTGGYRFGFTGQVFLTNEIYDYKNRNYNARLGRFLQPDPIGYGDGMNMYAYVKGDPVNFTDPTGLNSPGCEGSDIVVCGHPGSRNELERMMEQLRLRQDVDGGTITVTGSRRRGSNPKSNTINDLDFSYPIKVTYSLPEDKCRPDGRQKSGPVVFASLSLDAYIALGGGASGGGYYDTGTGAYGAFGAGESTAAAYSGSFGYGGSLGGQFGVATNISSFKGEYSVIGLGVGPLAINYTFSRGNLLSPISISGGPSLNLMPWPPVPGSFHYSQGNTSLFPLSEGGC